MKKWSEQSSDFLDALGGNITNPLEVGKKTNSREEQVGTEMRTPDQQTKKKITSIMVSPDTYLEFKKFAVNSNHTITQLLEAAMCDMLDGTYFPRRLH